jgi:hypothetical protein
MSKVLSVLLLLMISSSIIMGCAKTPRIVNSEVTVWWGNKEQIKAFLDSPQAQAERWIVQALK